MVQRQGGSRRKSRSKFRIRKSEKGKISIRKYFQNLENGTRVVLKANPSVQKGLYTARYHGKVGIIKHKRGKCYEVSIKDNNKPKTLIIHPIHLTKCQK